MDMSRSHKTATIALAVTLGAAACVADDPAAGPSNRTVPTTNLTGEDIILTSGLQTVGDCDALLETLIDEGLERVGPYGFGDGWWGWPRPLAVEEFAARDGVDLTQDNTGGQATEVPASTPGTIESGYTTTNVQEIGVDEADLVKTDGERLIVVTDGVVRVIDISTGTPRLVHKVEVADFGTGELFINGDTALLMSTTWTDSPILRQGGDLAVRIMPEGQQITRIVTLDLVSGALGRSIEFEGTYLAARMVDGSVRIVVYAGLGDFGWLYPSSESAEEAALEANKAILRSSTIDDWLPSYRIVENDETVDSGLLFDCDRTHLPTEFAGFGNIGVITADADAGFTVTDALGVITNGQTVYASTDRLTVATPRYPEWDWRTGAPIGDEKVSTALHSFDITDPVRATYVASGSVDGTLLNRYSLSEHRGYLRVATTRQVGQDWNDTQSAIVVLAERDGALAEVGRVDGLGKTEQIYAVRYQGDLAYVVTFRQIDPLYVIDLTDPFAPVARGELKIPGFSSYLHPLGDGLLLGIGQDATDQGRTTGLQVSLFDVADLDDPQRIDTLALGGEGSSSTVQWDPRAFTMWDGTALIPVESWRWRTEGEGNTTGVSLVRIAGRSLVDAGSVQQPSSSECEPRIDPLLEEDGQTTSVSPDAYCWTWTPQVLRTIVADGTLYTVSAAGVHSYDITTLSPGTWLEF